MAARNRRSIAHLIELRLSEAGNIHHWGEERSDDTALFDMPSDQVKPSKVRMLLSLAFIRARRRLRDAANTGSYYVNIYKEWFGYTFCCIIIKKKKLRGVLKSVKV